MDPHNEEKAIDAPSISSPKTTVVEVSAQDDRSYKIATLPNNKLTVLYISDPTTDKSAAAMDVRVGHLSDPDTAPGLAHFCEHMLFMGTEKYPNENEYNVYLSNHGGSSNAFTDMESTNYYFDVAAEHLDGVLDRFAQFFIEPRFDVDCTERELQAVDSEHAKNLQSDAWRMFQLSKSLCREDHPFRKFGSGNLKTLKEGPEEMGLNLRDMLLEFHATYYSANVMQLVVLGKESIEELEVMVEKYFSSVPNKDVEVPSFPGTPFTKTELCKQLQVVPVKDGSRSIDLQFPTREIDSLYSTKPLRYISHLIGHEGKGSILEALRSRGWANELSAGESRTCSDWSAFSISIDLTDEGLECANQVVEVVFAYLALLKESGPQKWIFDETSTVAECSFRFLSKRNPMDYVSSLAGYMQVYPKEYILSGPYKVWEYDPELIQEFMECFTPENMMLTITSKTFQDKTESKEHWYQTGYTITDLPKDLCDVWSNTTIASSEYVTYKDDDDISTPKLHLPEMNDMIASDFTLCHTKTPNAPKDQPQILLDTSTCRLWYKPDNVFEMPKVNLMAIINSPHAGSLSPEDAILSKLWADVLTEHTNDFTYLASMASLHCSIQAQAKGIELAVSGFSHKSHILLERMVKAMVDVPTRVDLSLFERVRDKIAKQYENFLFGQPYQHAFYAGDLCLESGKWSIEDKMSALENVNLDEFVAYSKRLLTRFHLEMLIHGNVTPADAEGMADIILKGLKPTEPFSSSHESRIVNLECGKEYIHRFPEPNKNDTNSCVEVLYQIGPMELRPNAVLALLHHLLKEPAFNELRTQEQLGYIVHTSIKTSGDTIKGLLFLIQSDSFDPIHIDSRIEVFVENLRSKIFAMSEEEFQTNVDAVIQTLLEKNKNLSEESSKYWTVITNHTYMFKRLDLIAEELKSISVEEVLQFFDKYVAKEAPRKKRFCIQVFAQQHLEKYEDAVVDEVTLIGPNDISEFKRSMPLYKLPKTADTQCFKQTSSEKE